MKSSLLTSVARHVLILAHALCEITVELQRSAPYGATLIPPRYLDASKSYVIAYTVPYLGRSMATIKHDAPLCSCALCCSRHAVRQWWQYTLGEHDFRQRVGQLVGNFI